MKRFKLLLLFIATACFIGISACQSAGKKVEEAVEDTMDEAVEALEEAEEAVEDVVDTTMVDTTAVAEDE